MVPTIRIDADVYLWLQKQARPFEDTPNSVLRRLAGIQDLGEAHSAGNAKRRPPSGNKTRQGAYRTPILRALIKHGGQASRTTVLQELEKAMAKHFTPYDKADIDSGTIRWQKTAEWEVRVMREEKLLKPVDEAARGTWALTKRGEEAAKES